MVSYYLNLDSDKKISTEGREWIVECANCLSIHPFEAEENEQIARDMSDKQVLSYIEKRWEGGLDNFVLNMED